MHPPVASRLRRADPRPRPGDPVMRAAPRQCRRGSPVRISRRPAKHVQPRALVTPRRHERSGRRRRVSGRDEHSESSNVPVQLRLFELSRHATGSATVPRGTDEPASPTRRQSAGGAGVSGSERATCRSRPHPLRRESQDLLTVSAECPPQAAEGVTAQRYRCLPRNGMGRIVQHFGVVTRMQFTRVRSLKVLMT